jgi:hypothetical protein
MAQAFAEMLDLGGPARQTLGCNGRARIMEHFRLASVVEQYATLYESLVAHNDYETTATPLHLRGDGYSDSTASDTINAAV